jgi:histidinol dehydrogenase
VRVLTFTDKSFHDDLAAFCRGAIVSKEISDSVRTILEDVRSRGDEAVSYFAAKFDGAKLAPPRVSSQRISKLSALGSGCSRLIKKAIESSLEAVVRLTNEVYPKIDRKKPARSGSG